MLSKNSLLPLSAAVVMALGSECYIASALFFILGFVERKIENEEEKEED